MLTTMTTAGFVAEAAAVDATTAAAVVVSHLIESRQSLELDDR